MALSKAERVAVLRETAELRLRLDALGNRAQRAIGEIRQRQREDQRRADEEAGSR